MPLCVVVVLGTRAGETITLEGEVAQGLGSGPDVPLRFRDAGVGPLHAWLIPYATGWEVVASSRAPVRVNGIARERAFLEVDDHLAIGRAVLRVDACTTSDAVRVVPSQLFVMAGANQGTVFPLGAHTTLGRGLESDVPLLDMRCSRQHCRIEHRRQGFLLYDLGSTNGTLLNEERLKPEVRYRLEPGDWIRTGRTVIEFQAVRPTQAATPPPTAVPVAAESLRRRAPTYRADPDGPALEGGLDRMSFTDLVQFLSMARKTGELVIEAPTGSCGVGFRRGKVVDAWSPYDWPPEETFFSLARLKASRFAFHEGVPPRQESIQRPTAALLMEAARLIDEATDAGVLS